MSFFKKLFGGSAPTEETSETYKEFRIFPTLVSESGGYRISARIEKDVDGETLIHTLIRADTIASHDDAIEATIAKAKQIIDEQGDRIFR